MISRLVRFQLVLFVIVTVVTLVYALINYVKLPQTLGIDRYTISMDVPSAGDIYPQASVTYRGVDVGVVKSVSLQPDGVRVTLQINDGTKLPMDSAVSIASTSAVGEQYVNFVSPQGTGPYWQHGATIPASAVTLPPQVATVLQDVDSLVRSIPDEALTTTVDELYTGLNGNAPALRQLIDSSQLLVHTANTDIAPTTDLIDNATQVLETQLSIAPNLESYSGNLQQFTQQLVSSDADLRGTIVAASGTAQAADGLFTQLQPVLPTLLTNLTSVGKVVEVYLPSIQALLTQAPATLNYVLSDAYSTPTIDGLTTAKLNLKAGTDSGYCTTGFADAGHQRDPADLTLTAIPTSSYCGANGTSVPSTADPRGKRFDPCPNSSKRSATAAGCGLVFDPDPEAYGTPFSLGTDGSTTTPGTSSTASASSTTDSNVVPYDPTTGLLDLGDAQDLILGDALPQDVPTSWTSLFYNTMGGDGR